MEPSDSQVPNREPWGSISIGFASDWVLTQQKTRVSRWAKVTMSSWYLIISFKWQAYQLNSYGLDRILSV